MSTTYLDRFDQAETFGEKIAVVIYLTQALHTNLSAAADTPDEEVRDRTVDSALTLAQDLTELIESMPVGVGYGEDTYYTSPYIDTEEWED